MAQLCSIPLVVTNSQALYDFASTVLGETLPDFVIGKTFFSHFCGGVSTDELVPVLLLFFFTLVTGPRRSLSLKLSDTQDYEP